MWRILGGGFFSGVLGVEHMACGSADSVVEVLVHPIEESTALSSSPLAILLKYSLAYSN